MGAAHSIGHQWSLILDNTVQARKCPPLERNSKSEDSNICRFPKGRLPPANPMPMMGKSGRKVLRDVSNHKLGRNSSKSVTTANRKESDNRSKVEEQDDALDRLLLVQSDLSALTHQVPLLNIPPFEYVGGFPCYYGRELVFAPTQPSA